MKNIFVLFGAIFMLSSCSWFGSGEEFYNCPNIKIPRKSAYLTQINRAFDDFQVQVSGFEGYCYYDAKIKSEKAVITPVFEISRLAPSKDCQVDFKFYTQTVVGPPEYIGKWTHHQSAVITYGQSKIVFKGKPVEMRIPSTNQDKFEIILGLVQTPDEIIQNQKTFDIKFDYREK